MKTVSTKIDNNDFDRLVEMCNDDGDASQKVFVE